MTGLTANVALLSLLSAQALAHPQANYPWQPAHGHGGLHHHHARQGNFSTNSNSTGYLTLTNHLTKTSVSTVYATVSPVAANSDVVGSSCAAEGQTVTETMTNLVTVTVTPGSGSSASAAETEASSTSASEETSSAAVIGSVSASQAATASASSSSESSVSSVAVESKAPAYTPPTSSASEAATTSAAAPSSYAAPSSSAPSSSSSSPAPTGYSSAPSAKRGVAYNDASLCSPFEGYAAWGWNWETDSKGLASSFEYVPTCKDSTSYWTGLFAEAVKSLSPKTIFSFNEPDNAGQANLDVSTCVSDFGTYISPHAGGDIEIVAPAVTNSQTPGQGLDYLDQFLSKCDGCQIDAINLHWYDTYQNAQEFINYVSNASATFGKKYPHFAGARSDGTFTTYVTEFGFTDDSGFSNGQYNPATQDQQQSCLQTVLPFLDSAPYVKRYSYYMVADGLLVNGPDVSQSGGAFQKYTAAYNG